MGALIRSPQRRTLRISFPALEENPFACALARIPWDLARPGLGERDLLDRNVIVVLSSAEQRGFDTALAESVREVAAGKTPLRVLLVYADATDSLALSWRRERELLMRRFEQDIMSKRNVEVDVLCHGVTRSLLKERISSSGGYHIIHWNGHGLRNRLELRGEGGTPESISGNDLVSLIQQAGGFIPQLVFLGACLSGAMVDIHPALPAYVGNEPMDPISRDGGSSGTALALIQAGVPQVVAMRYEVDDGFACALADMFYARLLADREPRSFEDALQLGRRDVAERGAATLRCVSTDRANPLAFGQSGILEPIARRASQRRRIGRLGQESGLGRPVRFVGRTRELTQLHHEWLATGTEQPLAILRGASGMGKSRMAAEAMHLWQHRFDCVVPLSAFELTFDNFYTHIHTRLSIDVKTYRERCAGNPVQGLDFDPVVPWMGAVRDELMQENLLRVLEHHAVLIVLDGFDKQLLELPDRRGYEYRDDRWRTLLAEVAQAYLPHSRLLMTSCFPVSALDSLPGVLDIELTRLPRDEVRQFFLVYEELRALCSDVEGQQLSKRLLRLAGGNPQLLDALAYLASRRHELEAELQRIERENVV